MKLKLLSILLLFHLSIFAQTREKAFEINSKLGRGINFGNMFEAPSETAWGNPWIPDYPRMIADLGFTHVRIPIRWEPSDRSNPTAPYTIAPVFLDRIKQVVDSCLNNGLSAIINMHHHEALFADPDGQKERFLAQWKQISEYFKDYPDQLLFEILNEPHGDLTATKWNNFLADALTSIRQDNPNRIVLIGTPEWGGLGGLSKLEIPDDPNIILTIHYYNPFHFTHQGAEWSEGSEAWLGTQWTDTETERQVIQNEFAPLKKLEQEQHIPIHIGEFGSYSKADEASRKKWTTYLARYFDSLGWSWAYWEFSAGFGIYNPGAQTFNQFLVDALLHNPMPEPAYYIGTPVYSSDFSQTISEWNLYLQSPATATLQRANNQLQINIGTIGTQDWFVQLVKNGIQLEEGKKYRVTLTAKATAERTITAYLGQNTDPWKAYSDYNSITLSTSPKEYSFVFAMNSSDNAARLVFDLGASADNVYFDSIVLESIELQEPTSARQKEELKTKIFPNPVSSLLTINNSDNFQQLTITNAIGKTLLKQNIKEQINSINMNQLASGIYFVSLLSQNRKHTTQIIKK
ncbi:MAG: cellulase family glycosylhydrolase [Draconibacterium sp.]